MSVSIITFGNDLFAAGLPHPWLPISGRQACVQQSLLSPVRLFAAFAGSPKRRQTLGLFAACNQASAEGLTACCARVGLPGQCFSTTSAKL